MPAAPTDSPSTSAPRQAPPAGGVLDDDRHPRRPLWPLPLLALLGWFVGLAPWFVARRTVGTFGTPWNPRNDMREALLPFHHERLVLLLSVVLMGGALAGCAASWTGPHHRRLAAATLVVLATGLAVAGSVAQTLSLRPDLGGTGSTEHTVQTGLVLLAATGGSVGLLLGLLAGLGGPALRLLAVAPLAVVTASWVGLLVTVSSADSFPPVRHDTLPTVLTVLTGVLVGLGLGFGPRPRTRGHAALVPLLWVVALALVWLTQSAFTAVRYFLENAARGNRVDAVELRELAHDVARLALDTFTPVHAPWREGVVAVVVGVVVMAGLLLGRTTRTRPGGDGAPD